MKKIKKLYEATIDLRNNRNKEYKKMWILPKYTKFQKITIIIGLVLVIMNIVPKLEIKACKAQNISIQDKIRLERLEVCQKAYKDSWIKDKFIYKQLMVVRCANYMTLVYAFESDFWKSRMCLQDKNCFWIKWNWVDTPMWDLKFKTFTEGREYFAKKYFKWHYKKKINTFVHDRAMWNRQVYISFMYQNYTKIYKELEHMYITQR